MIEIIIFGLLLIGGCIWYFSKRKKQPKEKEVPDFDKYQIKVANLTANGMEENRDFVTKIISIEEFNSKTPEQINDWIKEKIGREGTLSPYKVEIGLQELTYTSENKVYDVFFLLVEDTGQNVIDWKESKPTPNLPKKIWTIDYDVDATEDQTDYIMEQINSFPDGTDNANRMTFEMPKAGNVWMDAPSVDWMRIPSRERAILTLLRRKNIDFHAEGVNIQSKAPGVPYGGSVNKGTYSHRRHVSPRDCENISIYGLGVLGSNTIEGKLLGTKGYTPDFWGKIDETTGEWIVGENDSKAPEGYSAYQSYWEFEHGFDCRGNKNLKLVGCKAVGVWGDGFYFGHYANWFEQNEMLDCYAKWVGRQGAAAANSGRYLTIDNFILDYGRRTYIDLEPHSPSGTVENVIIRNGRGITHLTPFGAGGRGKINNVLIENNEFSGSNNSLFCRTSNPEDLIIRKNWKFIGNKRLNRRGGDAIKLGYMDRVVIAENSDNYSGDNFVSALFVRDLDISRNNLNGGDNLARLAGCTNYRSDVTVNDNTAAIPAAEVALYEKIKAANPIE